MDVADTFAPPYSNGHDTHLDEWNTSPPEAAPVETTAFGTAVADGPVDEAKRLAERLLDTASELSRALNSADSERTSLEDERQQLQHRVAELETAAARKDEFRNVFLHGNGVAVSDDDLQSLQSLTASLTADPDRLTTLFAVVQQAEKLATVVAVYTELRGMVDEG